MRILMYTPKASVACGSEIGEFTVLSDKRNGNIHDFVVYFRFDVTSMSATYEGYKGLKRAKNSRNYVEVLSPWTQLQAVMEFYQRREDGKNYIILEKFNCQRNLCNELSGCKIHCIIVREREK